MENVSCKVGIQVGQHTFTDIDYADNVVLLVDKEESFRAALVSMDEQASKFGLCVSRTKIKIQNIGSSPITIVDGNNAVDPADEFTYLRSIQTSQSNSKPENFRRIGLAGSAIKRLDSVWSQSKLGITTKLRIYSTCMRDNYYCTMLLYGFET